MKMKRISAIACVLVTLILIAVSCLTVFAAGDISGAIESTWNDAKSQIESVVNNVVVILNTESMGSSSLRHRQYFLLV